MADVIELTYPTAPEQVLQLLELPAERLAGLKMGTARLAKGEWVPPTGDSSHAQHEVSLIVSGEALMVSGGRECIVRAGDIVRIPAGEAHRSQALEDTEVLWILFGADAQGSVKE